MRMQNSWSFRKGSKGSFLRVIERFCCFTILGLLALISCNYELVGNTYKKLKWFQFVGMIKMEKKDYYLGMEGVYTNFRVYEKKLMFYKIA